MTARQLLKRGTSTCLFPYRAGLIAMPLLFAASGFAFGGVTGFDAFTRPSNVSLGALAGSGRLTGKDEALGSATAGPFIPECFFVVSASPNAFDTSAFVGARQGTSEVPAVVDTTRVPSSVPQKSSSICCAGV